MREFKAIIFDLGDTLIYFDAVLQDVLVEADEVLFQSLVEKGLKLGRAHFIQEYRSRMNAYFEERDSEFIEHTTYYVLGELLKDFGFSELPEKVLRSAFRDMYCVFEKYWIRKRDLYLCLRS